MSITPPTTTPEDEVLFQTALRQARIFRWAQESFKLIEQEVEEGECYCLDYQEARFKGPCNWCAMRELVSLVNEGKDPLP